MRWLYIARSIGSREIRVNGARASNQAGIRVHHFLDDYFGSSFTGSCYQSKIIIFFVNIAARPCQKLARVYVHRMRAYTVRLSIIIFHTAGLFITPAAFLDDHCPDRSSDTQPPSSSSSPPPPPSLCLYFRYFNFTASDRADTEHTFNCQLSIINHLNTTYHRSSCRAIFPIPIFRAIRHLYLCLSFPLFSLLTFDT